MFQIIEFWTVQGKKYPCTFLLKSLNDLRNKYPDLDIKYISYRYIPEWEFLTGLS